jgi:16S rRNA (guanine527-N7)-methyltransferase
MSRHGLRASRSGFDILFLPSAMPLSESTQEQKRRLLRRARRVNLSIPSALADAVLAYLELLALWNKKINLTALDDPDAAIDRLILEPLLAARLLPADASLIDIGSGGGSPAIPLKLAVPKLKLWMVESKTRKSAFLREAIRQLDLREAFVETTRYEELLTSPQLHEALDFVTIRAVRVETATLMGLQAFLKTGGEIFLFRGPGEGNLDVPPPLRFESEEPLVETLRSRLVRLKKLPIGA